jgi:extracellular elastinolytic metalloproteinase
VQGEAFDGADTAGGLPDGVHVNNANMTTFADGAPPKMQMFLFDPGDDPDSTLIAGNTGDTADVIYHEYTHGLSSRLVVDAAGNPALGSQHAGAMGEGWSDWYAMDFLDDRGLEPDTRAVGDVRVGRYLTGGGTIRTEPVDCPVGSTEQACVGSPGAGPGGYTFGDFGRVAGVPEVHADGEIWVQTLWDVRRALGSRVSRALVTRGMELSPVNPSFLDMRNSILQADLVVFRGRHQKALWKAFARRGMGFFAGVLDGDDVAPVEDFSLPPGRGTPRGSVTGTVTDSVTGAPVAGAVVAFGGHLSGFGGGLVATTDAAGKYTIDGILPGSYPKVTAQGPGFDLLTGTVSVASRENQVNWPLRRDFAASAGGATVAEANGEDGTEVGCGPDKLVDQSQRTSWDSDVVLGAGGAMQPRFVVVKLPAAVNVTDVAVDPANRCGPDPTPSTGDFKLETSPDGKTWTVAATGHFGPDARGGLNAVPLAKGSTEGVRFVRFTALSTQVADEGATCPTDPAVGCQIVGAAELVVHGRT